MAGSSYAANIKLSGIKIPISVFSVIFFLTCGVSCSTSKNTYKGIGSDYSREEIMRSLVENPLNLPLYPKESGLVKLEKLMGKSSKNEFFLDTNAFLVGSDGVIRYTILVRSIAGYDNVSYEGVHCGMKKWKVYAFGRSDNSRWNETKKNQWRDVSASKLSHRKNLYKKYLCNSGRITTQPVRDLGDLLRRLEQGNGTGGGREY